MARMAYAPRSMPRGTALLLLTLVLGWPAWAQQGFLLGWNVPCAAAPDVKELLGSAEGQAAVGISGAADRWLLEVVFAAPVTGTRRVTASSCEEAVSAAKLLLRLGATGAAAFAEPPAVKVEPIPEAPPPREPVPFRLEVSGLAAIGTAPAITPRISAAFGVGLADFVAIISVRTGFPASYPGGPTLASRYEIHPAFGAQASGCFLPAWNRLRVGPCASLAVEWWRVQGLNVTNPRAGSDAWLGIGLDARVEVAMSDALYAQATFGGRVGIRRPQVVFDDIGAVWVAPLFSAEGGLGLGWRW